MATVITGGADAAYVQTAPAKESGCKRLFRGLSVAITVRAVKIAWVSEKVKLHRVPGAGKVKLFARAISSFFIRPHQIDTGHPTPARHVPSANTRAVLAKTDCLGTVETAARFVFINEVSQMRSFGNVQSPSELDVAPVGIFVSTKNPSRPFSAAINRILP